MSWDWLDRELEYELAKLEAREFKTRSKSTLTYCLECIIKHLSEAREYLKEAIEYYRAGKPWHPFIRDMVDTLAGMRRDIKGGPPWVQRIASEVRDIRRYVFRRNLDLGYGTLNELEFLYKWVSRLREEAYEKKKEVFERGRRLASELLKAAMKAEREG